MIKYYISIKLCHFLTISPKRNLNPQLGYEGTYGSLYGSFLVFLNKI
jgi:hypothetical protein